MRLSHSKLSLALSNPIEYFLSYKVGIHAKTTKTALSIGSATHWGLEHDTEDLSEYFGNTTEISNEQLLAEAMVHGYRFHKDKIYEELLTDYSDGSKLELIEEVHEIFIDGKLKSYTEVEPHIFVGIIDLLLLTNKGFIVVDYKTSSKIPNWDDYLDQLYRYIFLLQSEFPNVPVYKLAIINLRKTRTRQLRNESAESYLKRLKLDYEINDDSFVNWHCFNKSALDEKFINLYIDNLSRMADTVNLIDKNNMWYTNFASTNSYGGSEYKHMIYRTEDSHVLYEISDKIFNEDTNDFDTKRDCIKLDMLVLDMPDNQIMNKYDKFKLVIQELEDNCIEVNKTNIFDYIHSCYRYDDYLLEKYWLTFMHEIISCNKF